MRSNAPFLCDTCVSDTGSHCERQFHDYPYLKRCDYYDPDGTTRTTNVIALPPPRTHAPSFRQVEFRDMSTKNPTKCIRFAKLP
jgi:hypothetical protein